MTVDFRTLPNPGDTATNHVPLYAGGLRVDSVKRVRYKIPSHPRHQKAPLANGFATSK
jgi:hypothetical protein